MTVAVCPGADNRHLHITGKDNCGKISPGTDNPYVLTQLRGVTPDFNNSGSQRSLPATSSMGTVASPQSPTSSSLSSTDVSRADVSLSWSQRSSTATSTVTSASLGTISSSDTEWQKDALGVVTNFAEPHLTLLALEVPPRNCVAGPLGLKGLTSQTSSTCLNKNSLTCSSQNEISPLVVLSQSSSLQHNTLSSMTPSAQLSGGCYGAQWVNDRVGNQTRESCPVSQVHSLSPHSTTSSPFSGGCQNQETFPISQGVSLSPDLQDGKSHLLTLQAPYHPPRICAEVGMGLEGLQENSLSTFPQDETPHPLSREQSQSTFSQDLKPRRVSVAQQQSPVSQAEKSQTLSKEKAPSIWERPQDGKLYPLSRENSLSSFPHEQKFNPLTQDSTSSFSNVSTSPDDDASVSSPLSLSPSIAPTTSSPPPERGRGRRRGSGARTPGATRLTADNNTLPPCRVCGSAASGFHYGVNTCEACKRFFRRSLDRKRVFRCRGDKNCSISNILLCAYCRHKRCLAVGMSKSAIKTGRYSHEKRSENIQEVRKRQMALSSITLPEEEVRGLMDTLLESYSHVVSNLDVPLADMEARGRQKVEEFRLRSEVFGQQYTLSDEQYADIFNKTGIDVDGRRQHGRFVARSVEFFVYGFVKFSKGLPGFGKLPLPDQAALLKEGWLDVWFLAAHRGFRDDMGIFYAPNKDCQTRSELCRSFGQTFVDESFRLARRIQGLGLNRQQVIVLSAVSLLTSDRCTLQTPQAVDDMQWNLIACLMHLLRQSHGACAMRHFARIVTCMAEMRIVTNEGKKALMSTHFTDIIQNHPILVDILE